MVPGAEGIPGTMPASAMPASDVGSGLPSGRAKGAGIAAAGVPAVGAVATIVLGAGVPVP